MAREVGFYPARNDNSHRDVRRCLAPQHVHQAQHRMLARNIGAAALPQRIEQRIFRRCGIDGGGKSVGLKALAKAADAVPHPPKIDLEQRARGLGIAVDHRHARAADPGIGDDRVGAAMRRPREIGERLDRSRIGHVADEATRVDVQSREGFNGFGQLFAARLAQDQFGARRAETLRQRQPDPRRTAGNDAAFPFKIHPRRPPPPKAKRCKQPASIAPIFIHALLLAPQ